MIEEMFTFNNLTPQNTYKKTKKKTPAQNILKKQEEGYFHLWLI